MATAGSFIADSHQCVTSGFQLSTGNGIGSIQGDEGHVHIQSKVIESLRLLKSLRSKLSSAEKQMEAQEQEIACLKTKAGKYEYQIKHLKRSLTEEEK